MLFLVLAYGHQVGVIHQDVRGHQHGIGKEGVAGGKAFGDLVLVGVTALQQSYGAYGAEYPGQFIDFRHGRLAEEDAFFRVQPHRQEVRRQIFAVFAQGVRVVYGAHGVVIRQKVVGFSAVLHADGRFHGSEVVADVQFAAGLKSCNDTHGAQDCACSRRASQEGGQSGIQTPCIGRCPGSVRRRNRVFLTRRESANEA